VTILEGSGLEFKGMETEPEPGLSPEWKLASGEEITKKYPLDEWLRISLPGSYRLECMATVEWSDTSLRVRDLGRDPRVATISSVITLEISRVGPEN
jgi:hypothetical protein